MDIITLHFLLMFIAFALLMPISVIIARYYKVTPRQDFPRVLDNKFWWHTHLTLMISATIMMTIALYVIYSGQLSSLHSKFGLVTALLVYLQIISGVLRGTKGSPTEFGDHYMMTRRRRIFEFFHKKSGWIILFLSFITISIGLITLENWLNFTVFLIIWLAYLFWIIACINAKRHVDTWKAIWGEKI